MPWSGGVYTRGYPSWTNDANNNLPISATKFDTEDNDFAAGLNNCLTVDGTNKPTSTLSWSQIIALSRASDGSLFSIARVSGTNNPSLTWSVSSSANSITAALATGNNALSFTSTAYQFGNATDNPSFTFLGTGFVAANGTFIALGAPSTTITSSALTIGTGSGVVVDRFINSGASSNNKVWDLYTDTTGQIRLDAVNDAINSTHTSIAINRSGTTITSIALGNTTDNAPLTYATVSANREIGFRNAEINSQSGTYTLLSTDAGRIVEMVNGSTVTIPTLPQGSLITIVNGSSSSNMTLSQSGITLRLGNSSGTTGNRTVAPWALALVYFTTTTVAYVFGGGVS